MKFKGSSASDKLYVRDFMILQPMPSRLGWFAHYLPSQLHVVLLGGMWFTEIIAPFFLFLPSSLGVATRGAALLFIALQAGIFAHGSFGHFNILTAILALPVFADAPVKAAADAARDAPFHSAACWAALAFYLLLGLVHLPFTSGLSRSLGYFPQPSCWPARWKRSVLAFVRAIEPWRLVHAYGVFPPHTAPGLKIIPVVEGWDGRRWRRYEYKFMISSAASPPRFCAPHQPRLDYRMFYEGLGTTPDNLLAGVLALQEPYAFSRSGFCDRLLQRLLEGDGPVARLFGVNPFAGGPPPQKVRMVTIMLEPTGALFKRGANYWTERRIGPHRPPTPKAESAEAFWQRWCDEPELCHWDGLYWKQACAERIVGPQPAMDGLKRDAGSHGDGLPAPHDVAFSRACIAFDGRAMRPATLAVSCEQLRSFWAVLVSSCRDHIAQCRARHEHPWSHVVTFVEGLRSAVDSEEVWYAFELILSRLTLQLARKLAPLLYAPGWPNPTATTPAEGSPAVGSWWDLMLCCHHIIMQGEAFYRSAMDEPEAAVRDIWPVGVAKWNVVEAVDADLEGGGGGGGGGEATVAKRRASRSPSRSRAAATSPRRAGTIKDAPPADGGLGAPTRLHPASAFLPFAVLRLELLQWHAFKWRLCAKMASPWRLSEPIAHAGALELVGLIKRYVPPARVEDGDRAEPSVAGGAEDVPALVHGEVDLLWRDAATGRRIGLDVAGAP